jgi:hypothetical protein
LSAARRMSPPDGVPFLAKPFAAEALLAIVAELLAARPSPGDGAGDS